MRDLFSRFANAYMEMFDPGDEEKLYTIILGAGCLLVWPDPGAASGGKRDAATSTVTAGAGGRWRFDLAAKRVFARLLNASPAQSA